MPCFRFSLTFDQDVAAARHTPACSRTRASTLHSTNQPQIAVSHAKTRHSHRYGGVHVDNVSKERSIWRLFEACECFKLSMRLTRGHSHFLKQLTPTHRKNISYTRALQPSLWHVATWTKSDFSSWALPPFYTKACCGLFNQVEKCNFDHSKVFRQESPAFGSFSE